jgi:phenylalanyl-tRNA synthetase beta subunit
VRLRGLHRRDPRSPSARPTRTKPEGRKSLAIDVTLQPRDKTLTDEDIDAVAARIRAAVEKATGGTLRG